MSKIIELKTENIMRLKAVTIKPDGSLVVIGGENGQGKSSTLLAIAMAIGGKDQVPAVPIRRGAEKGSIVVDLGDIIVKRTFTASGSSLVIEDKEKKRYPSPQALLDGLTGRLTFDPLSFLAQKPKEQLESLETLVGLDFTVDDQERERTYNERTVVNREVERAQSSLSAAAHYPEVTGSADLTILNKELQEAQEHNQKLSGLKVLASDDAHEVKFDNEAIRNDEQAIKTILAEIESLNRELAERKESFSKRQEKAKSNLARSTASTEAVAAFKERDLKPIQQKITNAHEHNRKLATNQAREKLATTLAEKKAESEALTKAIEKIDAGKNEKLAAAKFPVEGLSFGAGEVLLSGLPFSQASEAERMRVSVGMAAAMNPKLRVALVRNGSLLDAKNLALLEQLAKEHDLQVWIERVGTADPSAIIIEDGQVKGVTPEPAKETKTEEFKDLIL